MFVTATLFCATAVFGTLMTATGERRTIFTNCVLICFTFGLSYLASRPSWLSYDFMAPFHQLFDPVVNLIDRWA